MQSELAQKMCVAVQIEFLLILHVHASLVGYLHVLIDAFNFNCIYFQGNAEMVQFAFPSQLHPI